MRLKAGIAAAALSVGVSAGCAVRAEPVVVAPVRTLAQEIDSILERPPLHRTSWGVLVADAATGAVLYERNPGKLYIPASNTKLAVAVTALGRLGPDYRYRTPVLVSGQAGDSAALLIVRGTGDPSWSARVHGSPGPGLVLDSLAARVSATGLRRVSVLIADASRFTDDLVHPAWEVSDLPYQYAPPVDALGSGEGVFRVVVMGGAAAGERATAQMAGVLEQPVRVDVMTDTAGARARLAVDYRSRRDTVYITGWVGAGAADTSTLALTQPARSTAEALAAALRRLGVEVGEVRVVRDTAEAARLGADAVRIAEWESVPLSEIVGVILQPSQNWVAEQVLKTLGAELGGDGSWRGGVAVERAYLYSVAGIDSGAVNLRDASGMSAQNLLTPEAVVQMLRHARAQPWGGVFRRALAAPGLAGSTLNNRLRPLEGRLAGKTGTISNVNSLSGYFTTVQGREIVFAIMTNGSGLPSTNVRSAIDDIVLAMARHLDGG
jgi:D-alanyl-D-alanine carboxypeptidase/D-alanyl-D-alanine-endopeptidase (penicillin-binding protein 4)